MSKPEKSRILVVDDHPAVREGLRALFQSAKGLAVCGEAKNGRQAIAAVKKLQPDVVIVDISLGGGEDGIKLTRRLHQQWPALPVLVFSLHEEQSYCDAALAAGARGYCTKGEVSSGLLNAVRQVLHGKSFVSKRATR